MTDDISKVVREMRDSVNGGHPMNPIKLQMDDWANRLESAAAPVEVDDTEAALRYIRDWCPDSVKDHVATLARQLAEAKAANELLRDRCRNQAHLIDDFAARSEQAESQLAEATRRLGEVEGLVGKWLNEAVITRTEAAKLGPDELISAVSMNDQAHTQEDCAEELLTALTKEPTK